MPPLLQAAELECMRGERILFQGLSFTAEPGALVRISGANGSGKTSLLRMVCGLLPAVAGEIRWRGIPVHALRDEYNRSLVYVGHLNGIKGDLTAYENLAMGAALQGRLPSEPQIRDALKRLGLAGWEQLPARALSQGQQRRVALARLLLAGSRPLWVLDEPFAALDAAAIDTLREIIAAHRKQGGIALLTTHQEADMEFSHRIHLSS